jgi:LasA protease
MDLPPYGLSSYNLAVEMRKKITSLPVYLFITFVFLTSCVKTKSFNFYITPMTDYSSGTGTPEKNQATPTRSFLLPTDQTTDFLEISPTPDSPHYQISESHTPETYIVRAGDMLSDIALDFNVSVEALVTANNIPDPNSLEVGQPLTIPVVTPQAVGPSNKIIPDSELVYGPMSGLFDLETFIENKHGYLATFTENVKGEIMTGAQIVDLVAKNDSVNPRLLLAILDYRTGWLSNSTPETISTDSPFNVNDGFHTGLYLQLTWVADLLNTGYYKWKSGEFSQFTLLDGSTIQIDPTLNAGTVGVQFFFAQQDEQNTWFHDVSVGGFHDTYYLLFGNPFNHAIEPLIPSNLLQPVLSLPFETGRQWAFTGGPHSSWNPGTPFGALDFAPAETQGCMDSDAWVTAVADGLITRTGLGSVYQDLDLDGNEGSGWVILYMHVASSERVQPGTLLNSGDPVGHPSCKGGISNGTHLHIARKINGEWIPADGEVPFNLGGWIAQGSTEEGVGTLVKDGQVLESFDGSLPINQIQR